MNHFNVCQLCRFCKKGSNVFQIKLSYFDDVTGEAKISPIETITHFPFQCQFCRHVSMVELNTVCPPSCALYLKNAVKDKKEKIEQLLQQLVSLILE